jgi:site-specific recombinase XerD
MKNELFAMNTIKIFLRTDRKNFDGTNTVCLRLISNRRKKDVSLRIYVKERDWSLQHYRVNKSDPMSERKNRLITKFKNKALNIVDDYFFNNETLPFDDFEKKLFNKEYDDTSFIEFVKDELEKRKYTKETHKTYITQTTKLQRFKKNIHFSEINKGFINRYMDFMLTKLKNSPNTANKSLSMLKTFVNWGIEEKLIKDNPFNLIKITKGKGKREYLSIDELNKLEALYKKADLHRGQLNVLRYFLFACYTGLRYQDIVNLKFMHIRTRYFNKQEIQFIDLKMHKTGLDVSIPIISKAHDLLPKKYNISQKVFKVISNQKTNDHLKEIVKKAKIDKNITFHCSRHTLATTGLEMGIPIEVVSKILGHTNIKMTEIYAKVNDSLKYREMLKFDKKDDENAA